MRQNEIQTQKFKPFNSTKPLSATNRPKLSIKRKIGAQSINLVNSQTVNKDRKLKLNLTSDITKTTFVNNP